MVLESSHPEVIDFEDRFLQFISKLDEETKKTPRYKKIIATVEDEGDYQKALSELMKFSAERAEVLDKSSVSLCEGFEALSRNISQDITNIRIAQSSPERLLGNGATAEVFYLHGIYKDHCCVKIVSNPEMYQRGNTIEKEKKFLELLQKINIEGVRAPRPFYGFSNMRLTGLVMEELDAYNFRRIIEGHTTAGMKDKLPDNFNLADYFSRLKKYFAHLHSMGIYHGDIALRNLMIDRKTGLPYVIDFGKAKLAEELDKSNLELPDYANSDMALLDSAFSEAKVWMAEH